jgi:hypothetical protein
VSPELLLKVQQAKPAVSGEVRQGIPPEFAHLDSGEKMPAAPPFARVLAWAILALVVLWSAVGMFWLLRHSGSIGSNMAEREVKSR